jgi:bifunctional enzyme CysN/CysC
VARIVTMDGDLDEASAGQAVTLTLDTAIDVSRGDVLAARQSPPALADKFDAHVVWLTDSKLFAGRSYIIKVGTRSVSGSITRVRHRVDINTYERVPATTLQANDVAAVSIALTAPAAVERFADDPVLGGFIIIDRLSNATVGVGMIETVTQTATNIVWHDITIDRDARAVLKGQRPAVLWFTGLSASGKSTIANLVDRKLHALGRHGYILDGDNIRHGLNRDLGFSEGDRVENIRRAAEAARLMVDAGLIVLVSFISPYRADREAARDRFGAAEFIEVFVDTPIEECRKRDPKGLYARADAGKLRGFTGVDAPYEPPERPELRLATAEASAETLAERVIEELRRRGVIP